MTVWTAPRLAWLLVTLTILLLGLLVAIEASSPRDADPLYVSAGLIFIAVAFSVVGALVVSRYTRNAIGWIFCGAGLALAFSAFSESYGHYSLVARPGSLPSGAAVAWAGSLSGILFFFPVATFLLLLFPTGRLASSRWRPVAWASATATVLVLVGNSFSPGLVEDVAYLENPLGIGGAVGDLFDVLAGLGWLLVLTCLVLSALSLVVRFRRSRGEERQQLKWFVYAASLFALSVIPTAMAERYELTMLSLAGLPIATGIAILRYRLYDIDMLINRTLVYGGLSAVLGLVYVGGVVGVGGVLRSAIGLQSNSLVVAASTLAVAGLFKPAGSSIQGFIDRRFYRRKYDSTRTLEAFSARLRDEVDLESLSGELEAIVKVTMSPAHVQLWLRDAEYRTQRVP